MYVRTYILVLLPLFPLSIVVQQYVRTYKLFPLGKSVYIYVRTYAHAQRTYVSPEGGLLRTSTLYGRKKYPLQGILGEKNTPYWRFIFLLILGRPNIGPATSTYMYAPSSVLWVSRANSSHRGRNIPYWGGLFLYTYPHLSEYLVVLGQKAQNQQKKHISVDYLAICSQKITNSIIPRKIWEIDSRGPFEFVFGIIDTFFQKNAFRRRFVDDKNQFKVPFLKFKVILVDFGLLCVISHKITKSINRRNFLGKDTPRAGSTKKGLF